MLELLVGPLPTDPQVADNLVDLFEITDLNHHQALDAGQAR